MNRASCAVGIDLVRIGRIQESLDRFGERFLRRVFTPQEIQYCMAREQLAAEKLAARFAAKEATIKVLHLEGQWLDWRMIEVERSPSGWCDVILRGNAQWLASRRGIRSLSLSMSHEGDYATAIVLAEIDLSLERNVGGPAPAGRPGE